MTQNERNPLGPLLETVDDLANIPTSILTAAKDLGTSALSTVVEFGTTVANTAVEKSQSTLGLPVEKAKTLAGFMIGLLPALGDRSTDKQQ